MKKKIVRKKPIKVTKEVKEFVLEKMYEGMDILNIAKKYPDKVPVADTLYRLPLKDKDFEEKLSDAYYVLMMRRLDELEELAEETWCKDRLEQFDGDYKLAFEARRSKIDLKKFVLGKMAPILTRKFQKLEKIEVSGMENNSNLAIINYYSDSPRKDTTIKNKMLEE